MLSVIDITRRVASGESRAEDEIARCLDRIAAADGEIGAFEVVQDRQAALATARTAKGPLAGIAFGAKDIFDTHDLPTRYGSPIYDGYRPRADAPAIAMARRAGATVIGKTVTTEFAFLQPAATRNPHNPAHTPGGSSSGSAAAVAAGMIPASIGTQTGGSVIRPASYCGVAGYKPGFRLFPATGMKNFAWTLDTPGFFAASVADVAFLAAAMSGRDLAASALPEGKLRVGIYRSRDWHLASPDMQEAVAAAARLFSGAGAIVTDVDEPDIIAEARAIHATIQNHEAWMSLATEYDLHRDLLSTKLRETLEAGATIDTTTYDDARRVARRARTSARFLYEDVDILVTPSAPGAAPAGLGSTGDPVFNKVWTLVGSPCVNVPGLTDRNGMPLGVQVVARFGRDKLALDAASLLETLIRDAA